MKLFFLCLSFILNLNASNLKNDLILKKTISNDNIIFKDFKDTNFKKQHFKTAYIKFFVNKKIIGDKTYYLRVSCNIKDISYTNLKYEKNFNNIIFKLDKNTPKEILLNLKLKEKNLLKIKINKLNEFEYKYILEKENLLYGIAYGIIFCAFLYNFVIFLYSRENSFLYYSLMQLCLIIVLYYAVKLENQTYLEFSEQILADFFETVCILLMILFSKEILNTKKYLNFLNKVLSFLVYISIVDLITIFIFSYSLLYSFLPRSLIVLILVITGVFTIFKGQKIAIYYSLGWLVVFICLIIIEYDFLELSELYIIHIGLPLESIILSFALGYLLKMSIDEKRKKEKILIQQSKLASMGEMLNNIAHQWRQPLTNLSFINADLKLAMENKEISNHYLNEIIKDSSYQINFMSDTLDNFKGFYQPNKKKSFFKISQAVKNVINIINPILEKEGITLEFVIFNDKKILSYENEYSQVILNLLGNAKDVLLERKIQNPFIKLTLNIDNKKSILCVYDNAGGIEKKVLDKIFDPYFSTKQNNSGIGLYMTKIIVDSHLKGEVIVYNTSFGACFKIII